MAARNEPKAPEAGTVTAGKRPSDHVTLYIRRAELDALLEQALAAWRTPKWEIAAIVSTIIVPTAFTAREMWNDPAGMRAVVLMGLFCTLFFAGTVFGRWLRPRPSGKDIDRFAKAISQREGCVDYVDESKRIANTFHVPAGTEPAHPAASGIPMLCLVDYAAMQKIKHGAPTPALTADKSSSPGNGAADRYRTRIFYDDEPLCVECGKKSTENCRICGSRLCEACGRTLALAYNLSGSELRCSACIPKRASPADLSTQI